MTIRIIKAENLTMGKDVKPFFYYQFYTFEELYSHNSIGPNPKFEDTKAYEVTFDARADEYFSN